MDCTLFYNISEFLDNDNYKKFIILNVILSYFISCLCDFMYLYNSLPMHMQFAINYSKLFYLLQVSVF